MRCRLVVLILFALFVLICPGLAAKHQTFSKLLLRNNGKTQPGQHLVNLGDSPSRRCSSGMVYDKRSGRCRQNYAIA
ncbi:Hypothetical predicted protein [Cloeon dipterum]|uniref:Uncharacterized protein n=1 Tax=Cloeon dipterum TaxID=197152 RepID=A0A8S1E6B8_9INSE|nr:Hypothetical predicted protein [Cloeon dipterum]